MEGLRLLDDRAIKAVLEEEAVEGLDRVEGREDQVDGPQDRLANDLMERRMRSRLLRFVSAVLRSFVCMLEGWILILCSPPVVNLRCRSSRSPFRSSFRLQHLRTRQEHSPPCSPHRVSNGNRLRSRWQREYIRAMNLICH